MTDLITRARALSRHEHDDASIGDECAAEIERLTDDYAAATHLLADRDAQIERLTADLAAANAVIDAACGALHGEGVCDQGEAWDKALDLLDAARALRKGTR